MDQHHRHARDCRAVGHHAGDVQTKTHVGKMNRKQFGILVVLLIVLGGAGWLVQKSRNREAGAGEAGRGPETAGRQFSHQRCRAHQHQARHERAEPGEEGRCLAGAGARRLSGEFFADQRVSDQGGRFEGGAGGGGGRVAIAADAIGAGRAGDEFGRGGGFAKQGRQIAEDFDAGKKTHWQGAAGNAVWRRFSGWALCDGRAIPVRRC